MKSPYASYLPFFMQNTNVNYMRAFETGLKELPPGERIQRSGWKLKGGRTAEGIVRVNRGWKEIRKKKKEKKVHYMSER